MASTPTLTIRMARDLKQKLAKAAKADMRSITSYVCKAVAAQIARDAAAANG